MRTDERAGRWSSAISTGLTSPIVLAGVRLLTTVGEPSGQADASARAYVDRRVVDMLQAPRTPEVRTDRRLAVSGSAGLTSGALLAERRLPGAASGSCCCRGSRASGPGRCADRRA